MGQYRSSIDDARSEVPVTLTGTAVTLDVTHVGKTIYANASGAQTYTTPASTDTTIAVGETIRIVRYANQTLTVAGGSCLSIFGYGESITARGRYSVIFMTKVSSTVLRLGGDVATS
jgi:hypothetical protein